MRVSKCFSLNSSLLSAASSLFPGSEAPAVDLDELVEGHDLSESSAAAFQDK